MIDWPTVAAIAAVIVGLVLLQRIWALGQWKAWHRAQHHQAETLLQHITPADGGEYTGLHRHHQFTEQERDEIAQLRAKLAAWHSEKGNSGSTGFTPGGVSWTEQ